MTQGVLANFAPHFAPSPALVEAGAKFQTPELMG
jgi:hypothetical protein